MNSQPSVQPTDQQTPSTGVLLIGHGTRNLQGTEEFLQLAAPLRDRFAPQPISSCYLELRQPDIPTGIRQLLEMGVQRILAAPILLFAARHAREDIPAEINRALESQPEVELLQSEPLGCHPQLLALADMRLAEVLQGNSTEFNGGETHCIVVARGTSDAIARQAIEEFVESRSATIRTQLGNCAISLAYVAAAEPRLREALQAAVAAKARRIILLPHVLFHGEVLTEIRALAAECSNSTGLPVLVADHLAAGIAELSRGTEKLVAAFEDRLRETLGQPPA